MNKNKKVKPKRYVLLKDIIIPRGSILDMVEEIVSYDCLNNHLELSKDCVISYEIDMQTIKDRPDLITELIE